MTEEQVTKAIMGWLISRGWHIICFDFPQSGTGRPLHPDRSGGEKNKASVIPDIVAVKGATCVFFENKDRFYYPDYKKVNELIVNNRYTEAIARLLCGYAVNDIFYGIGLPADKHEKRSREASDLVDFIIGVENDKTVSILYDPKNIGF